ncbi:hypothetical protein [Candidatus Vondammii sp. HM_W22]|uniref:hypothetical protein n=1 Tax=Candidatus Vondammii sp. HM_W22 TaxID=2687299 RepID=UPI001F141351|nr:hypothetical protein [Candidatus Vondammii sp. HM_W22]
MRWILVTEEEFDTGVIPDKTLGDLLQRYGDTVSPQKKSHQRELNRIGVIQRDPLGRVRLVDLTAPVVAEWRDRKLTQIKPNTIRRDWVLLGS